MTLGKSDIEMVRVTCFYKIFSFLRVLLLGVWGVFGFLGASPYFCLKWSVSLKRHRYILMSPGPVLESMYTRRNSRPAFLTWIHTHPWNFINFSAFISHLNLTFSTLYPILCYYYPIFNLSIYIQSLIYTFGGFSPMNGWLSGPFLEWYHHPKNSTLNYRFNYHRFYFGDYWQQFPLYFFWRYEESFQKFFQNYFLIFSYFFVFFRIFYIFSYFSSIFLIFLFFLSLFFLLFTFFSVD